MQGRRKLGRSLGLSLVSAAVSLCGLAGARGTHAQPAAQDTAQARQATPAREAADAATKLLRRGRDLIQRESWAEAATAYGEFIAAYPKHEKTDAALYGLAFALQKQGRYAEAARQVERLREEFPRSGWTKDGLVLQLEAAAWRGDERVLEEAVSRHDGELKLIALQYLFQANPARAMTYAADILKPTSTAGARVQRGVVAIIGRHGGGEATTLLLDVVGRRADPALRRSAVAALGRTGNERALQVLGALAADEDGEIVKAALFAISQYGNERAHALLVELARTAPSPVTRREAVLRLAQKDGAAASGELLKLYASEQDLKVRGRVLDVLAQIGRRDDEQAVEGLIQLYDAEGSLPLKARILVSLGASPRKQAVRKLMAVAEGDASAELRGRALALLAQSRDPEAVRFLKRPSKRP